MYKTLDYFPKQGKGWRVGSRSPDASSCACSDYDTWATPGPTGSVQLTLFSCSPQRPICHLGAISTSQGEAEGSYVRQRLGDSCQASPAPSLLFIQQDYSYFPTAASQGLSWAPISGTNHNSSSDEISRCLETWRWKHKKPPKSPRGSSRGDVDHLTLQGFL